MDVVTSVRNCLSSWSKGGEGECRNILIAPHSNPSDPECVDVLTTAYHTLLCSTLKTWSHKDSITSEDFLVFLQSVLEGLPSSSSSNSSTNSSNTALFGDIVVDVIWSVDAELDEVLFDAKVNEGSEPAALAKQNAEKDKETLAHVVKKLLTAGIVNANVCRERLETSLSSNAGLIPDKSMFDKKEIRMKTGLFYKQNKFNLLREQSEGYSKLTAELTSSLAPPLTPLTSAAIEDRARPVWEKVISLIGYFDLDPNRALDIILDVLSVHLATHYTFFVALLGLSPWKGNYKTSTTTESTSDGMSDRYKDKTLDEVLKLAEGNGNVAEVREGEGETRQPRVMAQVLGFKFAYYQSPDVVESPPRSLYLTAAILIREGFISLEDLYPHMSPDDDGMVQVHKQYEAKVKERISGAKISQLAMAAPLEAASSGPSSKSAPAQTEAKKPVVEQPDIPPQKVGLLNALFAVGALRPAIALLSKFPWITDAYPEIADLVLRVLKHSMDPLYASTLITKEKNPSFTQPRARYGTGGVSAPPLKKVQLSLWAPTPPSTSTTEFVFFFPDWVQRVPVCESLDDLQTVIEPLMRFIGVHISRDCMFIAKLARLGRHQLAATVPTDPETKRQTGEPDPEDPVRQFWISILRLYFLPALSLIRGNAVTTVDVWFLLKSYDTTLRWRLYGEWKSSTYQSHPELRVRQVQADREAKGLLRRLSLNTIDSLSGSVAKLIHSNPCIFFTVAVGQIMAYDNMAAVVIQALRYTTSMGFDVLLFTVLDAFANPNKERVKDDGVNTMDWLQSLASFAGMLCRRYNSDITPILNYIVHQLYNGQTTEIIVLKELIWKMAGIEPLPDLSDSQVLAMAGGPTLRVEAVASDTRGARLDPSDNGLKSPQRLGKALLDSSLALPLLIQVAQQRQSCVFKAPDAHLKSLASLYDTTHGVLLQYLELLTSPAVVTAQDYSQKVLPPLRDLGEMYGISAPICMQIFRPVLNGLLLKAALNMQEQERLANEKAEKDLKAALKAKREPTASRVASPSVGENTAKDLAKEPSSEQKNPVVETNGVEDVNMEPETPQGPWLPELTSIFDDVKKIAPGNAYDVIGPGFYVTFWQLSTYDLAPPGSKYDEEVSALRTLIRQADSKITAAERSSSRTTRLTAQSHRLKRTRYTDYVNNLTQEYKEQTASRAFTIKRLAREKSHWFTGASGIKPLVSAIVEHCIQPRALLSPMDAEFCAQFIRVLHLQGTPGFYTLMCYDKLLGDHMKAVIFSCSEYEARNYGRFLLGILRDLWKWQQDEELYTQENRMKSNGKTILLPGMRTAWAAKVDVAPKDLVPWSGLGTLLRKWHLRIGRCLKDCIEAGDFMHVYNAIIVLKEILPVFPIASISLVGPTIYGVMEKFLETEERGDLKILGRAYAASLKKREPMWASPQTTSKATNVSSPKPPTTTATSSTEKSRAVPTGPAATTSSNSRTLAPSAPRAQLASSNGTTHSTNDTRLAMGSIPRPEVVKRVRPDKDSPSPRPEAGNTPKTDAMEVDRKPPSAPTSTLNGSSHTTSSASVVRKDLSLATSTSRPQTPTSALGKEPPQSPRNHRAQDEKQSRSDKPMAPPSVPSQTLSAQELRETAKQTMVNRPERPDDRPPRGSYQRDSTNETPVPRRRSVSPPSRPGTRNASADSRASGGRARSDRGSGDDKKSDRDNRQEPREHGSSHGRRDSRTDRGTRDREKDKDVERDRDRDRPRDRHGDREKERSHRDRDRERDRDRDRDRDRHRRDDKDRDRENRKDRDTAGRNGLSNAVAPAADGRGLPTRPDPSRHREVPGYEESLGKRRRPVDDEADRGSSKRSSRKDSHREDRSRRALDKDGHDRSRESDRRKSERSIPPENDARGSERAGDKRAPEAPVKTLPSTTPSAPRAMSSSDISRSSKTDATSARDRERKSQREAAPHLPPNGSQQSNQDSGASGGVGGSLRSRISNSEAPRSLSTPTTNSYRAESLRDEERDNNKKRTASDRERDVGDAPAGADQTSQPPKRPRINRERYKSGSGTSFPLAKKLLQTDPQAGDKSRSGRKD